MPKKVLGILTEETDNNKQTYTYINKVGYCKVIAALTKVSEELKG